MTTSIQLDVYDCTEIAEAELAERASWLEHELLAIDNALKPHRDHIPRGLTRMGQVAALGDRCRLLERRLRSLDDGRSRAEHGDPGRE